VARWSSRAAMDGQGGFQTGIKCRIPHFLCPLAALHCNQTCLAFPAGTGQRPSPPFHSQRPSRRESALTSVLLACFPILLDRDGISHIISSRRPQTQHIPPKPPCPSQPRRLACVHRFLKQATHRPLCSCHENRVLTTAVDSSCPAFAARPVPATASRSGSSRACGAEIAGRRVCPSVRGPARVVPMGEDLLIRGGIG
jgi:hypothetical protein